MNDELLALLTGFIVASIMFTILLISNEVVYVETDKLTDTKYIEYQNTIYTLTPYKKITKE